MKQCDRCEASIQWGWLTDDGQTHCDACWRAAGNPSWMRDALDFVGMVEDRMRGGEVNGFSVDDYEKAQNILAAAEGQP